MIVFSGLLGFLLGVFTVRSQWQNAVARQQEEREATRQLEYRARYLTEGLQLCWRLGLTRRDEESEEDYIARGRFTSLFGDLKGSYDEIQNFW